MLKKLEIGDFVDFIDPQLLAGSADGVDIILNETARWYCAVVRPGRHRRSEFELRRLGFRTFYPRCRKWASHARTKKAVEQPILGRYLFVEVDQPRQSFAMVRGVFEIESMVSNVGTPSAFPAHWVEGLLSRYMAGEWDEVAKGKIPVGARVQVVEGEFADQLATVTGVKGHRIDIRRIGAKQDTRLNDVSVRAA